MDGIKPKRSAPQGAADGFGGFDHCDAVDTGGPISFVRKEMLGTYIETRCLPLVPEGTGKAGSALGEVILFANLSNSHRSASPPQIGLPWMFSIEPESWISKPNLSMAEVTAM